jgi:tetratricopeptide (TPR) repeat protein
MTPAFLAAVMLAAPIWAALPSGGAERLPAQDGGPRSAAPARSEGQRFYDLEDYPAAADWYLQALRADPRDASLHYDLGNCLFKSGKTGRAIAAYERAFLIQPRDADIRQNLDYALRRAGEELTPAGVPPLLFLVFHLFSEPELAGMQWLAWWLMLALAGLCLWRRALRPRLLSWTAAVAALWLILAGWWLAVRGITPQRRGVIVASSAELRSGPGENFNVSFTVPEGRRVQILSNDGAWLELGVLKEGVKGWLPTAAVEEL